MKDWLDEVLEYAIGHRGLRWTYLGVLSVLPTAIVLATRHVDALTR